MTNAYHALFAGISFMAAMISASMVLAESTKFQIDPTVGEILEQYCIDCHEDGTEKGDVRLDNIAELTLDARLDMMNRMHEKVHFEEMPPKKKKDQPTAEERKQLEDWLAKVLHENNASKLEEKIRMPEYGNKVDHKKLFSGEFKDLPGFTPDRRWLISEFIFEEKFNTLLEIKTLREIDGKKLQVIGGNDRVGVNLTNPFLLPTYSGVRYYDTTTLHGGHLLTMITNGKEASAQMLNLAKGKRGYLPVVEKIMAPEWDHENLIAAREKYLTANAESFMRDLYKNRHEALLPRFVYTKPAPTTEKTGPDGKPLPKPMFDVAAPSRENQAEILAAMQRHTANGVKKEVLIAWCEREWFYQGVNDRTIQQRVTFMHGYLDDLIAKMPKTKPTPVKPLSDLEMQAMRDAVMKHRKPGDRYEAIIGKCMEGWRDEFRQERLKNGDITDLTISELVEELFNKILERGSTPQDNVEYVSLAKAYFQKLGSEKTVDKLIQTLILQSDFVYRNEFGEGKADAHGRKVLSPRDASYSISYALTDSSPDKELQEAAKNGKLNTREDYRREVERMLKNRSQYYLIDEAVGKAGDGGPGGLADSFTNIPIRKFRFFREFFGYPGMLSIFKDNKRFGGDYIGTSGRLVSEVDMLVEYILNQDKNVFEKLLTTEEFYVYHSGDNEAMAASAEYIRKVYEYFKDKDWQNFDVAKLKSHSAFIMANPMRSVNLDRLDDPKRAEGVLGTFKSLLTSYTERLNKGQTAAAPFPAFSSHDMTEAKTRGGKQMRGAEVAKAFNLDMANWSYPVNQPVKMPNRKGILTHPAWLIAFAANTHTDPIRRGKWVREKLLAGTVPDVPVTVDAVLPEDHHNTLRTRLDKVTTAEYCWGCHERMNPVGLPFEMYDDFGRYRMEEFLEHPDNIVKKMPDKAPPQVDLRDIYKTLPVDARGKLVGTDDPALDGDVKDAIDMIGRLAKSTKVRQSIIRHAFRYFMGRNEVLSDSKTLIDADQAYVNSGGSFDAVIVSLLTSDSFIYRKSTITR